MIGVRLPPQRQLRELRQKGIATATALNPEGSPAAAATGGELGAAPVIAFPLRPIGTLQSVFSQRNGTPRQPLIVPLARSKLELR